MSIKTKIMIISTYQPKLVTFGIGLEITFVGGTAIGMVETQQVHAYIIAGPCHSGNC